MIKQYKNKMKKMKYFIALGLFMVFALNSVKSQTGCPNIDAGPNQTLTCTNPCATLTATYLAVGETTTYLVSSIPYNPPWPYNTGTAVTVACDDCWSSIVYTTPFPFCMYGTNYTQYLVGS